MYRRQNTLINYSLNGFTQIYTSMELHCWYPQGIKTHWASGSVTSLIDCSKILRVAITVDENSNEPHYIHFYDANKNWIRDESIVPAHVGVYNMCMFTIPRYARYFRTVSYINHLPYFAIYGEYANYVEINYQDVTPDSYIDCTNGSVVTNYPRSFSSEYIEISSFDKIAFTSYLPDRTYFAFYDRNKTYVDGNTYRSSLTDASELTMFDIPSLAYYVRNSCYLDEEYIASMRLINAPISSNYRDKYFSILGIVSLHSRDSSQNLMYTGIHMEMLLKLQIYGGANY